MNWLEEVKEERKNQSFAGAMAILERELALRPHDAQVHYQIAWTHDALGIEQDAVAPYERAIELGLPPEDLQSAYLGLGSTLRTIGAYEKSASVFQQGRRAFPEFRALHVFYSLTLYNLGQHERAMEVLLTELVETTSDPSIKSYERALRFYSTKLTEIF
jgi:tetratricopeptide (TPR) repeat protein